MAINYNSNGSNITEPYLLFRSVFQTLIIQSCDPEMVISPSLVTETADTSFVCPDKM